MNTRDPLILIFMRITDSRTWCRLSQTCRIARKLGQQLLIRTESRYVLLPSTRIFHGPQGKRIEHKRKPIMFQLWYLNGNLIQECLYYVKSEKLKMVRRYDNNSLLHGVVVSYYKNGQVMNRMHANHGFRVGKEKLFRKDGTLKRIKKWGQNSNLIYKIKYTKKGKVKKKTKY